MQFVLYFLTILFNDYLVWPAVVHIVGEWFKAEQLGRVIAVLSVSSEVGYLSGKFGFGMLLYFNMNWKYCFFIAAIVMFIDNILSTVLLKDTPKDAHLTEIDESKITSMPAATPSASELLKDTELHEHDQQLGNLSATTPMGRPSLDQERPLVSSIVHNVEELQLEQTIHQKEEAERKKQESQLHIIPPHPLDSYSQLGAIKYFLFSGRFWLISVCYINYGMIFELVSFLPLYFSDLLKQKYPTHFSEGLATMLTISFNLGAILSIAVSGPLYDWFPSRVTFGRLIYTCVASVGTFLSCFVLLFGRTNWMPLPAVVVACFFTGLFTAVGWYIVAGVFSVEFSGPKHSAKLACMLDIVGYIAATIFDFSGGEIISTLGWTLFFVILTVGAALSIVCQIGFQIIEAREKIMQAKTKKSEKTQLPSEEPTEIELEKH